MRILTALVLASAILYGCGEDEPAATSAADAVAPAPPTSAAPTDMRGDLSTPNAGRDAATTASNAPAAGGATSSAETGASPRASSPASAPTSAAPGTTARAEGGAAQDAPAQSRAAAARSPGVADEYTIEQGDTLAGIAKAHGLDAKDLAEWNGIENPRRLQIGQRIRLSPPGG